MKMKKVVLLLTASLLLSGCDYLNDILGGLSSLGGTSSEVSSSESSSGSSNKDSISTSISTSNNTDAPIDSSEDITNDDSIYEKDAYKNIDLKSPDFSTRRISSIDDVTFEDLFNLGNRVTIDIDIRDEELQKLQNDYQTGYKSEIYHIADEVTITLTNYDNTYTWTYDQVGIRQKGNTSRKSIFENGEIVNLNHFKLSFDETFDDVEMYGRDAIDWSNKEEEKILREDREFLGLSGLDIKWNKNYDSTHIKEIYSSYLYDAAGLMANSIGLTELNITQKDRNRTYDFGLCTLFEPTSKSFIKRELKKGPYVNTSSWSEEKDGTYGVADSKYGDYYKASYGIGEGSYGNGADLSKKSTDNNRVGVGNISGSYIPAYERKTNTDVSYDDRLIKNLTDIITNKSYEEIEKVMDLEYFAITEACNYYIGNPDDLKNNNNNYTIYFRRTDGKAIIIPIDNDRCFGITKDWDPDGSGMTNIGVFHKYPVARDSMNDLHKKTILATSNDCKAIYLNYVKALKESSWTSYETFKELYDIAYETYGNNSTRTSFGDGFDFNVGGANGNWAFKDYINAKKGKVDLNQTITAPGSSNNGNNSGNSSESSSNSSSSHVDGYYGDLYLIGNFCGFNEGNKDYPLEYLGEGVYTITFTVRSLSENEEFIKWKIYDGVSFSNLDWTVTDGKLNMNGSGSSSSRLSRDYVGSEIIITINTLTKDVEVVKG